MSQFAVPLKGTQRCSSTVCDVCVSRSVVSDSLRPHGLQPTRLLCPWEFSRREYWSGLPINHIPINQLNSNKNEKQKQKIFGIISVSQTFKNIGLYKIYSPSCHLKMCEFKHISLICFCFPPISSSSQLHCSSIHSGQDVETT